MTKHYLTIPLALAGLALSQPGFAHVCNVDMASGGATYCGDVPDYVVFTPTVTTGKAGKTVTLNGTANAIPPGFTGSPDCPLGGTDPVSGLPCTYTPASLTSFSGNGWIAGTVKTLGDSHALHAGQFFTFSLPSTQTVTIKLQNDAANNPVGSVLNAAFSLYRHTLPDDGHDDNPFDVVGPVDGSACGFPAESDPADEVPYNLDPNVPAYLYNTTTCAVTKNPAYTNAVKWIYKLLYPANGPYRDTQNYVQLGGIGIDGYPVLDATGRAFYGQFNAKSNWSIANSLADLTTSTVWANPDGTRFLQDNSTGNVTWSEIAFLNAINSNNGTKAGNAETLTVTLPAGDYTIAAGGANSQTDTTNYAGVLSVTIK